jgi:hypothetical protein
MKYLKKYKIFLEQETSDDITSTPDEGISDENAKLNSDSLNMIKKSLEEFRGKKSTAESIFSKSELTDSEINSELEKSVFNNEKDDKKRNKYLSMLVSIMKLKRRVEKISSSIEEDLTKKSETQRQISELKNRFNEIENESQKTKIDNSIKKSEEYLKKISGKIESNKKELSLSEKNWEKKKSDFEGTMKIEEEKIKNLQK